MGHSVSAGEEARLSAVRRLGILDSGREAAFDTLARLTATTLGAPICLISIMDSDRHWYKAGHGLDMSETSREHAFCTRVADRCDVFVVNDALSDPEFAGNPYVTGVPHVRFYAGAPIMLGDGLCAGAICIIDHVPRHLDATQERALRDFAQLAETLISRHHDAERVRQIRVELSNQNDTVRSQARELAVQKRILDHASSLARIGAWERDLRIDEYKWSAGMYALHEIEGDFELTQESVLSFYEPEERERLLETMLEADRTNGSYRFEGEMITALGNRRQVRIIAEMEFVDDVPVRRYGMKQDITEEIEATRKITRLAERDGLTGLYNRGYLQSFLAERQAAEDCGLSFFLLDLDGFKDINDTYGHVAGDACLLQIADRLKGALPQSMLLSRVGGDEFAIVGGEPTTREDELRIASRINEVILQPLEWRGHSFELSTSIGISQREAGERIDPEELLLEADLALYAAKQAGRNRAMHFHEGLKKSVNARFQTLRNIRSALIGGELELYYQPKLRLGDQRHIGFEALLRWNCADGKVRTPVAFAEALADPKLSVEIGEFVIGQALRQGRDWMQAGIPFVSIAVNLSAAQFRKPDLAASILRRIAQHGLEPSMIEVEVTEGVFLSRSSDIALRICHELRRNGVRIAFDDFGTGFASLTHLTEFPVDIIKIDRGFVSQLGLNPRSSAVVTAMAGLARTIDMQMIAEGVETEEQASLLRAIGCGFAQGYLYSHPLPATAAANWVSERQSAVAS